MAYFNIESFKTQYFLVFSALNLLRVVNTFDGAVNMIGGSIVMTALAWNVTKYIRKYLNREYLPSSKKAVLITGSDKGLGHDLAVKLNEQGFRVYATVMDINNPIIDKLMTGSRYENLMNVKKMDVTNEEEVNKVAKEVSDELVANEESLWAVINTVEVQEFGHFDWSQFSMYEKIFDVNTFGTVRVIRAFLPLLRKSKGRIVNVESIAGRLTLPKLTAYCMSKHANQAFNDALRRELYEWDIKVSTVEMAFDRKAGQLSTQNKFSRSVNKQWAMTPDYIKDFYGINYLDQIKIEKLTQIFQNNLDETMDNLVDAVRSPDPAIRYTPYTTIKAKVWANLAQMVPTEWLDKYYYSTEKDSPKPTTPSNSSTTETTSSESSTTLPTSDTTITTPTNTTATSDLQKPKTL
ncbi:D-beta-hydroxybutyrate dehydrogenase, mitochondrial-like [Oppia nitens]|uniref:D-beta-hydroxybutyrate dehydrogenase, mitochondrial-like n=1 Tax=Oppia nitens TaxID=1686743 RepID=UPI0023DC8A83|nr:D-beta-hydroxybutyrate dehydrogenase, mitochondrial-like [Oppia nitens]